MSLEILATAQNTLNDEIEQAMQKFIDTVGGDATISSGNFYIDMADGEQTPKAYTSVRATVDGASITRSYPQQ